MDARLLEILVCPISKGPLKYDRERQWLISRVGRVAFPIRDGIPIMLESEAIPLTGDDLGDTSSPAPLAQGN